jgi:Protein of unknown function (DUF3341)
MAVTPTARQIEQAEAEPAQLYGLIAEFGTAAELLRAARRTYAAGFRAIDTYSPFPVDGLSDAIGFRPKAVPLIALFAGMLGAATGYGMQFLIHAVALPINVGGRPLNSWPSFVPVTFELGVLFAALSLFFGLLLLNGHPEPYHPVFNVAAFARASRDRFFLCIESRDPHFHIESTRHFLENLGAREVSDVRS